jgi:tRNA dimethylallyltransferase
VALELAGQLGAEIVSADSMQVYRGMDIGTAKPTAAERTRVPHHLLDVCEVGEVFDANRYGQLARAAIAGIHERGHAALIVGGTGLYVRVLRQGMFPGPGRDDAFRAAREGWPAAELFAELERLDPVAAATIDRHNPRRLIRALEVFQLTGRSIRAHQQQWRQQAAAQGVRLFGLNRPRAVLGERIDARVDAQMAAGWLDEVRRLRGQGLDRNRTALQAAGYAELLEHLRGRLPIWEAVHRIKTRTRQVARRQITWFRHEPEVEWVEIDPDESPSATATRLGELLEARRSSPA